MNLLLRLFIEEKKGKAHIVVVFEDFCPNSPEFQTDLASS